MKITLKGFAENMLFMANAFIIFLLVFGHRISVPYWLQPLGRMHPMVLHFPIVILLLAMLLEFFRFKDAYAKEKLYHDFTSWLLLSGTLFSAVTVIMGLFLSKEEAYSGSTLQWHKWTGVSIVLITTFIYYCRNSAWYKLPVARGGAVLTILSVILAGHYGAALTHGDNFVLEAVTAPSEMVKVPLEQAKIFDDVVMPIFSQKCLSCHNIEKAKGNLIMDNAGSILKGGKTGKLFVPGKPGLSLLLERIHLPLDEKKHMPPRGKSQLSEKEMELLKLWVKSNAEMKKKVTDLPANDSLRLLATTFLAPTDVPEEKFEFAAADETTVKKLNNNYRNIYPLAKESPALAVNIYNKSVYKPSVLKELSEVKKQIVSLNLSGMPLGDEDLKIIAGFENLRKLNLNFTNINGTGLKYLTALEHLNALSLSGTRVSYNLVKQLVNMNGLRQLTLWNTALTGTELSQLQKINKNLTVIAGFKDDGKHPVKLNKPRLNTDVTVFKDAITLQLKHLINGVEIRYTTDGTEPDSLKSPIYNKEIVLKGNTTVKARAYKPGWYGSDLLSANFYRSTYKPDSIFFLLPANEKYRAGGATVLTDGQLGDYDFNLGKWIAFRENDMEAMLYFKRPVTMQSVTLHAMKQIQPYIFPPTEVEIWGGTNKDKLHLLGRVRPNMPEKMEERELIKIEAKFKPQHISCLKIVAKNLKKLPEWHPAKGQPAWLFVDEIFLN
ncbi:FN3 associated domain-containing protein [Pedobacter borealis]|uniref:FN3 associated domain-containing protein n=1 Tax=Pedobacter borealis TaxID=475254 RepID=UPI0004930C41|nr:FN3 associated domain-containing protein [Pedobacter borealis]